MFSPNVGKYGAEKIRIRMLFTQFMRFWENSLSHFFKIKFYAVSKYVQNDYKIYFPEKNIEKYKIWLLKINNRRSLSIAAP